MAKDINKHDDVARTDGAESQNKMGGLWWPVAVAVIHNIKADQELARGLSDKLRFRYLMTKLILGSIIIVVLAVLWVLWGKSPR